MQASEMNQAFRHLDRRGTGTVLVADALRAVRGEVNARRARAIDDAFDSLLFGHGDDGGHNSETLDPTTVAKLFRAEAHPDVVSGARAQGEVLSEFLEAFEGKCPTNFFSSDRFFLLSAAASISCTLFVGSDKEIVPCVSSCSSLPTAIVRMRAL